MTIKEAIEVLEQDLFSEYCTDLKEALTMAIKSLEAWEIVKGNLKYYVDNIKFSDAYREGFEISLKIIDNYLAEVEG